MNRCGAFYPTQPATVSPSLVAAITNARYIGFSDLLSVFTPGILHDVDFFAVQCPTLLMRVVKQSGVLTCWSHPARVPQKIRVLGEIGSMGLKCFEAGSRSFEVSEGL